MTSPPYEHPPITEAVIEFRFAESISEADKSKISADFKSLYPHEQLLKKVGFEVNVTDRKEDMPTAKLDQELGVRRSSLDSTELLLIWPLSFAISQLAPYQSWEVFFERFKRDWAIWKKAIGYKKINRIGVRYINRIDIPASTPVVEYEKYVNVYPHLPAILNPVSACAVQAQMPLSDINCTLTLNSTTIAPSVSPMIGYLSYVIDLDIAKEIEPPQNDEAIFGLLNQIRLKKNEVFEACVSDDARRLFHK